MALIDRVDLVHDLAHQVADEHGVRAVGFVVDLTTADACQVVADQILETLGHVDVLALVAGVLQEVGAVADIAKAEWDHVMTVNLKSPFLCMRAFIPHMRDRCKGAIVTISSWYGKPGHGLFAAYCASRARVVVLTQRAAEELAGHGVRVNSVAPGNIATSMR